MNVCAIKKERIYVKVNSDFDLTGYMEPKTITWNDGRIFRIDKVTDFRPASSLGINSTADCYTVIICGEIKHLFFERTDPMFPNRFGRWYVECNTSV